MNRFLKNAAAAVILMTLGAGLAHAEAGDITARFNIASIMPDGTGDVTAEGNAVPGEVVVGPQIVPDVDVAYFVTDRIAAELSLSFSPHSVKAKNITAAPLLREDQTDTTVDFGETWLVTTTLAAQYHFEGTDHFKPYVGAGLAALAFTGEDEGRTIDDVKYDAAFGPVLQAGLTYDFDGQDGGWGAHASVQKIWASTDAKADLSTAAGLNPVETSVDIDPVIASVGLSFTF